MRSLFLDHACKPATQDSKNTWPRRHKTYNKIELSLENRAYNEARFLGLTLCASSVRGPKIEPVLRSRFECPQSQSTAPKNGLRRPNSSPCPRSFAAQAGQKLRATVWISCLSRKKGRHNSKTSLWRCQFQARKAGPMLEPELHGTEKKYDNGARGRGRRSAARAEPCPRCPRDCPLGSQSRFFAKL